MRSLIFGVEPVDAATYAAVGVLLGVIAVVATLLSRAARVTRRSGGVTAARVSSKVRCLHALQASCDLSRKCFTQTAR